MKQRWIYQLLAAFLCVMLLLSGCSEKDKEILKDLANQAQNTLSSRDKEESAENSDEEEDEEGKEDKEEKKEKEKEDKPERDEEQDQETGKEETEKESSMNAERYADEERLYRFLQDELIPEYSLASLEAFSVPCMDKESTYYAEDASGILSADVHDFNKDGHKEMVTFSLEFEDEPNTPLGLLMNYSRRSLVVRIRLYLLMGGEVVQKDEAILGQITQESFGFMAGGVRKSEGTYYIYGCSQNDDNTTYGPTPGLVYHVEGDHFVFDHINGRLGWGQSESVENPDSIVGAIGTDFAKTTVEDVMVLVRKNLKTYDTIPSDMPSAQTEAIGESLRFILCLTYGMGNPSTSISQAFDTSDLHQILEKGYAGFMAEQPGRQEETDVHVEERMDEEARELSVVAEKLAMEIAQNAGVALTLASNESVNGRFQARYTAPGGEMVYISLYENTGALAGVTIYTPHYDMTEDWIYLKDGTLNAPSLGLNRGSMEAAYGNCNNFYLEDDGTGARVVIGQAVCCTFSVTYMQ